MYGGIPRSLLSQAQEEIVNADVAGSGNGQGESLSGGNQKLIPLNCV
jgi:hypothetical protein